MLSVITPGTASHNRNCGVSLPGTASRKKNCELRRLTKETANCNVSQKELGGVELRVSQNEVVELGVSQNEFLRTRVSQKEMIELASLYKKVVELSVTQMNCSKKGNHRIFENRIHRRNQFFYKNVFQINGKFGKLAASARNLASELLFQESGLGKWPPPKEE